MGNMVAVLVNIRSVHNVGSIFRTADAAGVSKIYLCGITPTPLDRFGRFRGDFTKVSLGAERYVAWEQIASAARLLGRLKRDGYLVCAVEQSPQSVTYDKFKIQNSKLKIALIFGNEVNGLPQSLLARADHVLEIPMRGAVVRRARHPRHTGWGKESLNVAVAFGIVAFHLLRHPSPTLRNGYPLLLRSYGIAQDSFGKVLARNTGAKGIPKL
ncbi:MAG: TrmH family RNA methyltransferase [Candidatus Brennerbacteria bacterium]